MTSQASSIHRPRAVGVRRAGEARHCCQASTGRASLCGERKHLFRVQLPFYHEKHRVSKQLELRWRLPSETLCKRFAGNLSPAPP